MNILTLINHYFRENKKDGTLTIAAENGVSLNGQLKFPATQNASADANTLDDYEEGTYTATAVASSSGTITLGNDLCSYQKIGNTVTAWGRVTVSSVSTPVGDLRISLPFAVRADGEDENNACGTAMLHGVDLAASTAWVVFAADPTNSYGIFLELYDNSGLTVVSAGGVSATDIIQFSITYGV